MAGGTLVVSRSEVNHNYYKKTLESMGKKNVRVTSAERDGLNFIIDEMKPDLMIMGARFYQCSTPYMMGVLREDFPWLNMAAVCYDEYPADLGMYFILNGINSYFNWAEGIEQFNHGIEIILKGKTFMSEIAQERIYLRKEMPPAAKKLKQRQIEIIRCLCNGFTKKETADNLCISEKTVETYKQDAYRCLNVDDITELYTAAIRLNIVTQDELVFRSRYYTLKPLPENR
jgi:DNA-binding NarL/FixJ family response regulator